MFIQKEMPLFQQELVFGTFSFTFSMSDSESVPWEVPESDPWIFQRAADSCPCYVPAVLQHDG